MDVSNPRIARDSEHRPQIATSDQGSRRRADRLGSVGSAEPQTRRWGSKRGRRLARVVLTGVVIALLTACNSGGSRWRQRGR